MTEKHPPHVVDNEEEVTDDGMNITMDTALGGFRCPECGYINFSRSVVEWHIKTKHTLGKGTHLCTHCGRLFKRNSDLMFHMESVHNDEKNYECSDCGRKFSVAHRLHRHVQNMHLDKGCHRCNDCGLELRTGSALNYHQLKMHRKKFICPECGKQYLKFEKFEDHMNAHTGHRPHECDRCHKKFTSRHYFLVHKKKHEEGKLKRKEKAKAFICDQCGKTLKCKQNLQMHMRSLHKHPIPSQPPIVEAQTESASQEHVDLEISGYYTKLFKCDACDKLFRTAAGVQAHLKRHFSERPFCGRCGKLFNSESTYERHVRTKQLCRRYLDSDGNHTAACSKGEFVDLEVLKKAQELANDDT